MSSSTMPSDRSIPAILLIDIGDYDKFLMDLAIDKKIVVRTEGESKNVYSAMYFYMEQNVQGHWQDLI